MLKRIVRNDIRNFKCKRKKSMDIKRRKLREYIFRRDFRKSNQVPFERLSLCRQRRESTAIQLQ